MQVSLVIPVRNEEKSLPALIESIRRQTRQPDEIILVDGGSSDATIPLIREICAGDARFRLIEAGAATPGRGRNLGIAAARHEWIALTDAGIRAEPTWLERLVAEAERRPELEVVYGNFEPMTTTWFECCAALAYPPPKQMREGSLIRGPSIVSSLLLRSVWKNVGGFPDLRAAEDLIFMRRIDVAGHRVGWAPTATVWWELRPTLVTTFRKFVLYSKVNVWGGQQRDWHYGTARKYLLALPFVVLGILHSPWWFLVLVFGALARVVNSIARRREGRSLVWALQPAHLFGVALILLTIDMATFVGWLQAKVTAPPQPAEGVIAKPREIVASSGSPLAETSRQTQEA